MKKTSLALIIGALLIVVGVAAYGTLGPCTIRMCGRYTGYQITNVTLTRIDYYDGCNWCSISSLIVSAPIGGTLFASGAVSWLYQNRISG